MAATPFVDDCRGDDRWLLLRLLLPLHLLRIRPRRSKSSRGSWTRWSSRESASRVSRKNMLLELCSWLKSTFCRRRGKVEAREVGSGKKKKKKKKTQSTVIRLLEKTSDRLAFRDLSCCSSHRASDHSCASNPSPRHRSREKGTQKRTERAVFGTKARGAFFPSSSTQSKKISLLQFLLPLSSSLSPSANPWLRPPSASPKPLSRSGPGMR